MPATDSEPTSMEAPRVSEIEEGSLTNMPSSDPPTTVPSPPPLVLTGPHFTGETAIETKAISVATNDCSAALSSPAEASPAKPAVTPPPTTFDGTSETSPATSRIASASDSLTSAGTSLVSISESVPALPVLPPSTFGCPNPQADFPAALTFKGVTVSLENSAVWKQFNSCGTEMILTKQGRRMFPYCRYRLSGLDPQQQYSLVLSIVPSDPYRYRWSASKWEVNGPAEHQAQGLIRAFSHHYSPCHGSSWMGSLVSFYKLKLTNNPQDHEGHIILHSMHRYIPRLHVIPVPAGDTPTADKPVTMGPECMTFTFPQTEFMAVTTYQNFRITQLKINHNPFAKGFREDGNNSRLNRIPPTAAAQPAVTADTAASGPTRGEEPHEEDVNLSKRNDTESHPLSSEKETRLVLQPIMSTIASNGEPYVPCIRGKHALGELVLVEKRPCLEPKAETHAVAVTPKASAASTPRSSPGYRRKKKRPNRRWGNSRGREWKAATASPTVVHSPSLTVAMQPELDDVEGLLFVSFSSKEALEVHVKDKVTGSASSASPASPTPKQQQTEVIQETDEEKVDRLEAVLLQDLIVLRHRQVIHPVLQEVGMKLSSLDQTASIDLQYLGVNLPLPPPKLLEPAPSPGDKGLPFISRTGKTSDLTKIKGWRNKFIRLKQTPPSNQDGSQKNLSAFCSNMLDEYLENEAQYISERAAAFSANPEGAVAYQLPAKSSSYVKTLDSVLKHRNAATKVPRGSNKPCPLSYKALLSSAPASRSPPLASPAAPAQTGAQPALQSSSSCTQPAVVWITNGDGSHAQRLPAHQPRPPGFTKFQLKLLQMETEALSEGLRRTQMTPERLNVALSVILTKEMQPSQFLRVPPFLKTEAKAPPCGEDFCRLGCVCSSLQHLNRGPAHCRRPDCMFGCGCFKQKISKQLTAGETEPPFHHFSSATNVEHLAQPRPGSHVDKLWNRSADDVDPDPIFAPKRSLAGKAVKRSSTFRPTQPIREEDKDPVYKYLESMMTCARVREFNSKPPPDVTLEPKILDPPTPDTSAKPEKTPTDVPPKMYYRTLLTVKKTAETLSLGAPANEPGVRKQMEIQSACQWDADRKKILEALCRRMNQDKLSQRFSLGPYCICPVSKIFIRKPSGSLITYRVLIRKRSQGSDNEDGEESSSSSSSCSSYWDEDMDTEEEGGQMEEPVMQFGVTPFLSGVLPAGKLKARTKPVGVQAAGLVQVNGKSYNQARLLLGNMGSLHPANRLAAYITGRLHAPADASRKTTPASGHNNKVGAPGALPIKAAGAVVPPVISARKTTELKTAAQPPAKIQPDRLKNGTVALPPPPAQSSSPSSPIHAFVMGQRHTASAFQNSSTSSHVSLTVSPSLKTPSFLGQSGTYSFRICPPANQNTKGKKLPGVVLPGGFTLIQLPKHGADQAPPPAKAALCNVGQVKAEPDANGLGVDAGAQIRKLLSGRSAEPPGSSPGLRGDRKPASDKGAEAWIKQLMARMDTPSEDLSSDSSDYCAEEDEELVDIETVEEVQQGMAIAKMRDAARKALTQPGDSCRAFKPTRGPQSIQSAVKDESEDECKIKRKRKNHTVLERQRRSEQRYLFDKLASVLDHDPNAPRLRLLSLAVKEIQDLCTTSTHLEEKKKRLMQLQTLYVKQLSVLTGGSDNGIKSKKKEVSKPPPPLLPAAKWKPFFSDLLRAKAAMVQGSTPPSDSAPVKATPPAATSKPAPPPPPPLLVTVAAPTKPDSVAHPLALPLPRTKTGRIILPSSLKPAAKGFYAYMVMNPNQKEQGGEVNVQPVSVDPSKSQDNGAVKPAPPSEEDKLTEPKHPSDGNTPLAELALLNKSIYVPLDTLQATEKSAAAPQPDPSPVEARRSRGRPPKRPHGEAPEADDSRGSLSESEEKISVDVKVTKSPAPVKRGRGRPPKKKRQNNRWSSPLAGRGRSPDTKPKASPATSTPRPLTRGALGKDFPSAKKRSWIDVEKELEPEEESE